MSHKQRPGKSGPQVLGLRDALGPQDASGQVHAGTDLEPTPQSPEDVGQQPYR